MAQRRRDLVYLDRSKTIKLLESSDWGRAHLTATEHQLRPGMTREQSANWAMEEQWRLALAASATVQMSGIERTLDGLEVVFLPREEVSASCEVFPDGSGLVSVSDALSTLVWRLATFNSKWRGGTGLRSRLGRRRKVRAALVSPEEVASTPEIQAAIAALRYSTQHIRVWGMSAAIGLRKESAGMRDGIFAGMFVHAHEIGHFILGHDLPAKSRRSPAALELEADEFAVKALLGHFGSVDRVMVGSAAIVALCAMQVWESAALVRDIRTHPPLLKRWQAIAQLLGPVSAEAEAHTFAARVMSATAATPGSIPPDFWDALRADAAYDIVHGLPYLLMVQGFDTSESLSMEERDDLINTLASASPMFVDGWKAFRDHGWHSGYDAWGIDPAGLLEYQKSLSYLQIINKVAASPAWGATEDVFRRTCALLAIPARLDDLRPIS